MLKTHIASILIKKVKRLGNRKIIVALFSAVFCAGTQCTTF